MTLTPGMPPALAGALKKMAAEPEREFTPSPTPQAGEIGTGPMGWMLQKGFVEPASASAYRITDAGIEYADLTFGPAARSAPTPGHDYRLTYERFTRPDGTFHLTVGMECSCGLRSPTTLGGDITPDRSATLLKATAEARLREWHDAEMTRQGESA